MSLCIGFNWLFNFIVGISFNDLQVGLQQNPKTLKVFTLKFDVYAAHRLNTLRFLFSLLAGCSGQPGLSSLPWSVSGVLCCGLYQSARDQRWDEGSWRAPSELRAYSVLFSDRWLVLISGRTVEDISRGLQGLAPLVRSNAKYTEVDA